MIGELLGGGADLTGRKVRAFGRVWEVEEKNYLGDWTVFLFEDRPDGKYRIVTSIAPEILPLDHGHYAELL
jgi:hypothetical protein